MLCLIGNFLVLSDELNWRQREPAMSSYARSMPPVDCASIRYLYPRGTPPLAGTIGDGVLGSLGAADETPKGTKLERKGKRSKFPPQMTLVRERKE